MNISITVEGDKIVIENFNAMPRAVHDGAQAGLKRLSRGIHRQAVEFLGGDGSKGISRIVVSKKTGKEYLDWKKRDRQVDPGGYPVPTRTGALRRLLFFTGPGESFGTNFDNSERDTSVKAGNMQAFIYNTAEYAGVIHEGRGSSSKFGPRRFLRDALENFNSTGSTVKIVTEEIEKAICKL